MINAKDAREKTEKNRLNLTRLSVDKAIAKAVENGREQIYLTTTICKELVLELIELGYKVEEQATGMKISW